MSWWDPIVSYFGGGMDGGFSGAADALGQTASNAGDALGSLFSGGDSGSSIMDLSQYGVGAPTSTSSMDSIMNRSQYGVGGPSSAGLSLGSLSSGDGALNTTAPSLPSGAASTGIDVSSGLDKAGKWLKSNNQLIDPLMQAGLTLTHKTGPAPATQQAVNLQNEGNASAKDIAGQKTAVGQSMINQAPFQANNAYAGALNQNAANETARMRQLNAQGYHAGDAMYDSAMAEGRTTGSQNAGTAWAQGQNNMANQEKTGADLMTAYKPDTSAYGQLGLEQNAQQTQENLDNAGLAGAAKNAYDIYSNPDKAASKTKSTV